MKKFDESEGVWRTIGGRRVFIRKGQGLSDAMKESGKFKARMNEKAVKGAREEDLKEQYMTSLNNVSKLEYDGEITKDDYDEAIKNINKAYIDKRNENARIKKENIKTITQEEYDKLPRDYKGTLKELVNTAEFRGENKDELIKFYEKQGFNIEEDKTILENENGGTILRPVKINKSEDKFYTRKDGTKEYDPYKGTRFEKKYDSVEDALNDPNHPTRKYIDENLKEYQERMLNDDNYLQANRPNVYFNKMIKETPYIKTLEKHNLNDGDSEFKRAMLGRMESDINYYLGNGSGYAGHLWAKDEEEQINIMKALYNTLPEKEKPDWINEGKIEEYSKMMQKLKSSDLKTRFKSTYEYMKNNTTMSELEILEYLKKYKDKKNI